jgi:hypothetical protein
MTQALFDVEAESEEEAIEDEDAFAEPLAFLGGAFDLDAINPSEKQQARE